MEETIQGGTTIGVGDHLRAAWNTRNKRMLAIFVAILVGINVFNVSPLPTTGFEIGIEAFAVAGTAALFALGWLVLVVIVIAIYGLRLGKDRSRISYDIGPDAIMVRDGAGMVLTTPWGVVRRARESARAFRIELKPMGTRYIPKRAFAAGDLPLLRALIRGKLGKAARLEAA